MPISVMIKPSSSNCNLQCEYCFYNSVSNSRKEKSKGFMSNETAKNVITSAFEFTNGSDVFFTFQGGEPLLSKIEFFDFFVSEVKKQNKNGSKVSFCVQTNGTLIDDYFAKFFNDNNFLVGISLDGDLENNKYRVDKNGKNSFDDVIKGIELLKKYGVTFNVISVLTKNTARNIRNSYKFFKRNNLNYMQFITCLKPFDCNENSDLYMDEEDYSFYLQKCFKLYFNDIMRGEMVSVRQFDNYLQLLSGNPAEQCGMNGVCSNQFVVEGDGTVYPCDFYCTDEWELGNINQSSFKELYNHEKAVQFLKESFIVENECKNCEYFSVCRGGGCKRYKVNKNYCSAYKEFFKSSVNQFRQLKGNK